jgi:ribosomal protein S12 methylthiotransferase
VDAEEILGALKHRGYMSVHDPENADILIVNTCAFIRPAEEEALQVLVEAAVLKRRKRVKLLIAVSCLVSKYGEKKIRAAIPEVDYAFPPGKLDCLVEAVEKAAPIQRLVKPGFLEEENARVLLSSPGTAYLKIAEGCSRKCAFCLIPALRGPLHSRPIDAIVAEAKALAAGGVRELILIAQDITSYGNDLEGRFGLTDLLDRLVEVPSVHWIRLMYVYPDGISEGLVQRLAGQSKLCKYLDMPLQHASRKILRRMGRAGDGDKFLELIAHLRQQVPGIALRTTLITGFPGEGRTEYQELVSFIQQACFDRLGVFPYWREKGTLAAKMSGQISSPTRKRRQRELMDIQAGISRQRLASYVGSKMECLVEEPSGQKHIIARTFRDAPEVDGGIIVTGRARPGEIIRVRVTGSTDHDLTGVML